MKTLVLPILIFFLAPSFCLAQAAKKITVAVDHHGDDRLGQAVAFALKEAIRGSKGFFLVDHEVYPKTPRIIIYLVSLDNSPTDVGRKGLSSAISDVITYASPKTGGFWFFMYAGIQTCGQNKVELCAKSMLPKIDEVAEMLRNNWPDLWKTL